MSESTILTFKKGRAGKGGRKDSLREKERRRVDGLHPPLSYSLREVICSYIHKIFVRLSLMPSSMGLTYAYREVIRVLAVRWRFSNDVGDLNSPLRTFYTNPRVFHTHCLPPVAKGGVVVGRASHRHSSPPVAKGGVGGGRVFAGLIYSYVHVLT